MLRESVEGKFAVPCKIREAIKISRLMTLDGNCSARGQHFCKIRPWHLGLLRRTLLVRGGDIGGPDEEDRNRRRVLSLLATQPQTCTRSCSIFALQYCSSVVARTWRTPNQSETNQAYMTFSRFYNSYNAWRTSSKLKFSWQADSGWLCGCFTTSRKNYHRFTKVIESYVCLKMSFFRHIEGRKILSKMKKVKMNLLSDMEV